MHAHTHLTIELPDEMLAESLRRHLQSFEVDALEVGSHWELRIDLLEHNSDSRVTNALHAIDAWLPTAGIESVRVRLDGSGYTLHAPPVPTASWRRPAFLDAQPVDELAKG